MKLTVAVLIVCVSAAWAEQCTQDSECTHTHCVSTATDMKMFCEQGVCLCDFNHPCTQPANCESHFGTCGSSGFQQGAWHCVDNSCSCSHGGFSLGNCLNGNILDCISGIGGGIGK